MNQDCTYSVFVVEVAAPAPVESTSSRGKVGGFIDIRRPSFFYQVVRLSYFARVLLVCRVASPSLFFFLSVCRSFWVLSLCLLFSATGENTAVVLGSFRVWFVSFRWGYKTAVDGCCVYGICSCCDAVLVGVGG